MVSNRSHSGVTAPSGGSPARCADGDPRVAGCAIAGTVSSPPSAARPATAAASVANRARRRQAPRSVSRVASRPPARHPSASAAAGGPTAARTRSSSTPYFETGFDLPFKLVGRVHQAVPERDLEDQPGPVHEPDDLDAATAVGRQPAGPDPPAVDGVARQGRAAQEPRRLRHGVRLGQVARRPARPEPRRAPTGPAARVRCTRWG